MQEVSEGKAPIFVYRCTKSGQKATSNHKENGLGTWHCGVCQTTKCTVVRSKN